MWNTNKFLGLAALVAMLGAVSAQAEMRIGWQTGDVNPILRYLAETGRFDEVGLEYSLKPFPAGPAMLPALAAREVDIAWMGEFPAVTGYANGIPISIFMIDQEWKSHIRVVAQPDSGMDDLSDLEGKKIGITFGSSGHNHIFQALKKGGLTDKDVTLVNLQPGQMPGAFAKKEIDAVLTWEPNVGKIEAEMGGVTIATTESIGTTLLGVWVVRRGYLEDHPDELQQFLKAWEPAIAVYNTNRQEILPYEAGRLDMPEENFAALLDRQNVVHPPYEEQLTEVYMGQPGAQMNSRLMKHFQGIAQFMVDLEKISEVPDDWSTFVDVQPLSKYLSSE